jgi:hypothetical protein
LKVELKPGVNLEVSDWAVFWSGVGGVIVGTLIGAVMSFLIARYTLLRTRDDGKQLARAERNEDAARRITEALIDLQEALSWDRQVQVGPIDWFAAVNQAIESLARVTKLDIPILASLDMGRRVYSARRSAQAARDWMLPTFEHYQRGLITEDELSQELSEVISARPIFGIVTRLISDLDLYRNSGQEPALEELVVSPPEPEYVKELRRLEQKLRGLSPAPSEAAPVRPIDAAAVERHSDGPLPGDLLRSSPERQAFQDGAG